MGIFLFLELWCAGFALPVRNTVHTKAQMENFIALFYYSQCLYTVQQQKQARKNTIYICLELFYTVKVRCRTGRCGDAKIPLNQPPSLIVI